MKLKPKHRITFAEADRLIERYYEGKTSVEEEKRLTEFLSKRGLPERFATEQAIFGYFETRKQKPVFTFRPYLKWVGSAAAAMIIFVISLQFVRSDHASYAYIDGVKVTNMNQVKAQAFSSINDISGENNEVQETLDGIGDNQLIKQQLDVFSEMNK